MGFRAIILNQFAFIFITAFIFAGSAIAAEEPNNCNCTPESKIQLSGFSDGKLVDRDEIMKGFNEGQERVRIIVNLAEPAIKARTNWNSKHSLKLLRDEIKSIQTPVLSGLSEKELRLRHCFDNQAGFSGEVTLDGLEKLKKDPRVISIEPVYTLQPHLRQGISLMHADTYRSSYNGDGVAIAICDTGVDYTHPMLGGGGFPNGKVIGGYDFGDNDSDPMPNTQAHGTSCAGIAAGNLGETGDYIGGVANNAKLYALKMTAGTTSSATNDAMIAAWDWCVTHKNDDPSHPILVISTSFGGGRSYGTCDTSNLSMTQAANNAAAAGITVLASSGNDGYCDSIAWPACISSVISVGAVYDAAFGTYNPCVNSLSCATKYSSTSCSTGYYASDATAADKVTSYSNTASFLTILAPSNRCYTADIVGSGGYSTSDYYSSFGGTSAACPYAAGTVACLQSAAKVISGSYLSPSEIRTILTSTGDNVTDGKVAITKPRVNLAAAIVSLGGPPTVDNVDIETPSNTAIPITLPAFDDGQPEPASLSYIITSLPSSGSLNDPGAGGITAVPYTLVINGNQVVYTPAAGYAGVDSFTFKANDGGTPPYGGDSNEATVSVSVGLTTVVYQVSASYADTYASAGTVQSSTKAYLQTGYRSNSGVPYYMSGMQFANISIPASAHIVIAKLEICSYNTALTNTVYGVIQGEDADNAADFSGRNLSAAVKTTAAANWDHSSAWSADTWYASSDISSVVQEIIDRPGWSAGNSLVILYSTRTASGSYRSFSSYDRGSTYAPKLEIKYYVNAVPVTRTLTVSSGGNGSVTAPGEGAFQYTDGTAVNLAAVAASGYNFVNWTGSGVTAGKVANSGSANTIITMDGDYTVVANFAINQYTITASAGANGSIIPSGAITKDYGSSQLFTASPATGYEVDKWTLDGLEIQTGGATYTLSNITAGHTVGVTFKILVYTISGTVTAGGGGLDGVVMTGLPGNPVTVGGGLYSVTVDYGWGGTVTPTKTGYSFAPESIVYTNVTENKVAESYTASLNMYAISGFVVEVDGNTPVAGVVVDGGSGGVTDVNGYYEVLVPYGWSGVVGLAKEGYTFEPNGMSYDNVIADEIGDYTATLSTFVISGYVLELDGVTPIGDVNVSAENGGGLWTSRYGGGVDITDANGYYEVVVDYNWAGKVTPAKYAYGIEPNSITYANVLANQVDQDYAGKLLTFVISGHVLNQCSVPISNVTVTATTGGSSTVTDANGYYEVWVDYNWTGTITAEKDWYIAAPINTVYENVLANQTEQDYQAVNKYDLDCDTNIDYDDLYVIGFNWLQTGINICDFDADNNVNFSDFAEFAALWLEE